MSQRVLERGTPDEEADIISHVRSSRSLHIPTLSTVSTAVNSANSANPANPAMQVYHISESGPRGETPSSATSLLLHRSHSTTTRSSHAARPTVPGTSEFPFSRGRTSSPSPSLSSSQSVAVNIPHATASDLTAQLGASYPHPRSTPVRRQPASRSSHGIETSTGPPPALSTQRSYTTEVTRRRPAPVDPIVSRPSLRGRSQTDSKLDSKTRRRNRSADDPTHASPWQRPNIERRTTEINKGNMDGALKFHQPPADDTDGIQCGLRSKSPSPDLSTIATPAAQPDESSYSMQEDEYAKSVEEDRSSKSSQDGSRSKSSQEVDHSESPQDGHHAKSTQEHESSKSSQEDLFLNLAKSGALADDAAQVPTRRHSRSERSRVSPASALVSTLTAVIVAIVVDFDFFGVPDHTMGS